MNRLWKLASRIAKVQGCTFVARVLELLNFMVCGCAISVHAEIGEGTKFYHRGLGCVVHPNTIIGKNCIIFQNVTIGSRWSGGVCEGEAPSIGNNVMVGAGAVILGNVRIADNVIIGANAVVITDIPENSIALGVPAIVKQRNDVGNVK